MTMPWPLRVLDCSALADHLVQGGAAVIPTDTVPGLAVCPASAQTIWELKRRPSDKPLILMGADVEAMLLHALPECRDDARVLAKRYWPGALTLVLPADGKACSALNPGGHTLGMRIPDCSPTRSLLERSGPLATSSANPSGEPVAMTPTAAAVYFPDLPQLGPQPWPQPSGLASTVIAWSGLGRWRLLRQGAVVPQDITGPESTFRL